jgi:hypothetical protein
MAYYFNLGVDCMTFEEKVELAKKFCKEHDGRCGRCPAENDRNAPCEKYPDFDHANEQELDYFIDRYICKDEKEEQITEENDIINHPSHYCRDGAMESIDEMVLLFGREVVKHFCLCNIWKYRYRSNAKNGEEDIKKSDWYVRKFQELSEYE